MDKFVIEKEIGHNLTERAEFFDEKQAFESFSRIQGRRRLGVTSSNGDVFLLQASGNSLPELLELKDVDPRFLNLIMEIRERWILQAAKIYRTRCQDEARQLLDMASAPTARRQKQPDFKKEIRKRMTRCSKLFLNHRMEGFDFRQTDLQDAIFINCELTGSNFSNVNLQNTVFVNCKLDDTVWYEAFTNNAFVYHSDTVTELKDLKGGCVWQD